MTTASAEASKARLATQPQRCGLDEGRTDVLHLRPPAAGKQRDQRLDEDRVAHPGRRDDQDALGGHGTCAPKRDGPQCGPSFKRVRRGRRRPGFPSSGAPE